MKRSLFTLMLAAIASVLLLSNSASAQCPSSIPDCPGTPWTFGGSITMTIYNPSTMTNCTVQVSYCYRNGCGYYDYFIKEIAYTNCLSGTFTQSQILQMIRDKFIETNPENFPCAYPQEPATIWRFILNSCYRTTHPTDDTTIESPCDGQTAWCYTAYTTGCDIHGHTYIIDRSSGTLGTPECSGLCYDICNKL